MKKLFLIFLLLPFLCFSQTDSLHKKKIGFQFSFPFEVGLSYYLPGNKHEASAFSHFLNHRETVGTRIQLGGFQLQFHDRFYIEASYNFDNIGLKKGSALKELQGNNPGYFIQAQSEFGQVSGETAKSASSLRYLRIGLGYSILLKQHKYIKPYVFFDFGKASLPNGNYSFKEYTSNSFFVNHYSYNRVKCAGFNAGLSYDVYLKQDEPFSKFPVYGIKLEYSNVTVKGEGKITSTDLYLPATESMVPVKTNFSYITIGLFIGISSKKDKRF